MSWEGEEGWGGVIKRIGGVADGEEGEGPIPLKVWMTRGGIKKGEKKG